MSSENWNNSLLDVGFLTTVISARIGRFRRGNNKKEWTVKVCEGRLNKQETVRKYDSFGVYEVRSLPSSRRSALRKVRDDRNKLDRGSLEGGLGQTWSNERILPSGQRTERKG